MVFSYISNETCLWLTFSGTWWHKEKHVSIFFEGNFQSDRKTLRLETVYARVICIYVSPLFQHKLNIEHNSSRSFCFSGCYRWLIKFVINFLVSFLIQKLDISRYLKVCWTIKKRKFKLRINFLTLNFISPQHTVIK